MKDYWPWIADELRELPGATERRMFGCLAFYRAEKLIMVLTGEGEEPWNGVCLCVERDRHPGLLTEFPALSPHPVLGKWLHVSCDHPDFEKTVARLLDALHDDDPRLGVIPKPKRRRAKIGGTPVKKQKTR